MPKLLQIAQLGHPILRQKTKAIKNVADPQIKNIIDDLLATVKDIRGMGLAAPQVYESYRIFIMASHPSPRYPNAPEMEPTPVINPQILSRSDEVVKDWEGCLSVPGIRGLVPRYKTIVVKYKTREGKSIRTEYTDFVARIFQHEYDHLDGIIYLDRLESVKDIITDKEFQKLGTKKVNK